MSESYELEPWGVSPGAPVPAPKYVPFNGKMTPGNYYSHSLGYSGRRWDPKTVDGIYKQGVRVNQGRGSTFRPTAWNQIVEPGDLGSHNQNKMTAQRLGHEKGAREFRSPRRATIESSLWSTKPRTLGARAPTFILKGDKSMFLKPGPDFIPNKGGFTSDPAPKGQMNLNRPYSGNINPKRIVGHFPAHSTQMVTKPGFVTGRMPTIRALGGGMVGMLNFGPIDAAKQIQMGQHPQVEPEKIPDRVEYLQEPWSNPFPDQGGSAPGNYYQLYKDNPKAGEVYYEG
jgi:hypothetical protein